MIDSTWKIQLEGNVRMMKEMWLGEENWLDLGPDLTRDVLLCLR